MRIVHIAMTTWLAANASTIAADPWIIYPGGHGAGAGKRVVLISGDEEYRSEETLTQMGRILAQHHGFSCTVLYAIDPMDGTINPNVNNNIPGLQALRNADLMVIFTRYRDLPDNQMTHIADYVDSGRPIIGLRTATHAFNIAPGRTYFKFGVQSKDWPGGFGQQVLGETWVAHHGAHGKEGTRGLIKPEMKGHPIVRGIKDGDIFGTSDVYTIRLPLGDKCNALVLGEVTTTLDNKSPPVVGKKNDPMMPVAWTKTYNSARVFTTTMGAAEDFNSVGLRRLLINAVYWTLGIEDQIAAESRVDIVGTFEPSPFKTNGFKRGIKPADLQLK